MKSNIALVCLSNNFLKNLGQMLADDLDMFFADIDDILEYNLVNDDMLDMAGKDYFDKEKEKVIKSVCQYDNSVICGRFETIINNVEKIKDNSLLIYIKINDELFQKYECSNNSNYRIKEIAFEEENQLISQFADISLELSADDKGNIEKIKSVILDYYKEN